MSLIDGVRMNLKTTTVLAIIMSLTLPWEVKAQTADTQKYKAYRVSCRAESACQTFDVTYQTAENEIAQTRRTRSRRRNRYAGFSVGLLFEDFLDLGFQVGGFGGIKFNEYISADAEITFGFAGYEAFDETLTIVGFFINPRFQYKFDNSDLAIFVSPGLGIGILSAFDDTDTEFGFQLKTGASLALDNNLNAYAQVRFQDIDYYDPILLEGGLIFD
ncbi:MAG: outer membrane beta-barrel protein [Pleurocapsa sp. MO_226.B13]|nr:outer membrane beta-barrel protein [Pleurocapsa sp. MO_226.B13]